MAIPKRKNISGAALHTYNETSDSYSPIASGNPLPTTSSDANIVTRTLEVGSLLYTGKAADGSLTTDAVWQVSRWTDDGAGAFYQEKADGDSLYDNTFDDPASLSYS